MISPAPTLLTPGTLDHVVIAVGMDLDAAMSAYRKLGFSVVYGGVHASGATHNALIWFPDGAFIELMALTGQAAKTGEVDYSPMIRERRGVAGVCLRPTDFAAEIAARRGRGESVSAPEQGGRLRPDGVQLTWQVAFINGGIDPFLIEWLSPPDPVRLPRDPAVITHANGVTGLIGASVSAGQVRVKAPAPPDPDLQWGVRFITG